MKWTAREVARTLYLHAFNGKHLVWVPNCYYPGSECDILVVRNDLRMMDVEIKISRSDLKADAGKDKWIESWEQHAGQPWIPFALRPPPAPRTHPKRIWKHYYAMPEEVWKDDLAECVQPASGIIFVHQGGPRPYCHIHRQAKPNKAAEKIDSQELCEIARLATERMYRAFDEVDAHRRSVVETEALKRMA